MLLSIDINFKSKKRKETNMKIIKQIGEIERDWNQETNKQTNNQTMNERKKERKKEDRTRSQRERERGGQLSV